MRPGDILVLDNLSAHHAAHVEQLLAARGWRLLFLPAYSPDLSPIEQAFSRIKHFLRQVRAQTVDALLDALAQALHLITPTDVIGYFTQAGLLNRDP